MMIRTALGALALVLGASAAHAQASGVDARGTAYFVYAEPGAPTMEVLMIGAGIRNGIYRYQEGTTLLEAVVLAGGLSAGSDSTEQQIVTATLRVVRETSGANRVVYQTTFERFLSERLQHPDLLDGDVIETNIEIERLEVRDPVTFLDVVTIVSRAASLVSVVLLLINRL